MIIYKENIQKFIEDCLRDDLVFKIRAELKHKKGIIPSKKEEDSWKTTLKSITKELDCIKNKDKQYILLEFVIPNHRKRIDVILVGSDNKHKNMAIIELKGWSEIELVDNSKLLKVNASYGYYGLEHPAYEIWDYYDILKNQYSNINDIFKLYPITYLPNFTSPSTNPLLDKKYDDILNKIDVYSKSSKNELIDFLKQKFKNAVDTKDVNFLNSLEYKPSKSFIEHAKQNFANIELRGSQRNVFDIISTTININKQNNKKTLYIISGAAGSGKSVIAFKLLAKLMSMGEHTTLMIPGIEFRNSLISIFKDNDLSTKIHGAYSKAKCNYAIIDEAHKASSQGTTKQFYNELFKSTNNVIVFLDDMQVINKKGMSKSELIDISEKYNYAVIDLRLEEQFRNGGDASYIEWLKKMLYNEEDNGQAIFITNYYEFNVLDEDEFNSTYKKMYETNNVRMVSFWTQTWDIHSLDENNKIRKTVKVGNSYYAWNPNNQWLSKFKQNNPKFQIPKEIYSLCEKVNFITQKKGYEYIAYFNTIQGSEFEYIFVHIPKLFFLNEKHEIDVNIEELHLREMQSQIWSTKNIKNIHEKIQKEKLNKLYFLNRLFVCLTRGTKGTYVYIEDENLKKYFQSKIKRS